MSSNPITTGRIGRRVYDLRHWKLTLFVAVVIGIPTLVFRVLSGRNLMRGGRSTDATFFHSARETRKNWWDDLSGAARAGVRLLVVVGVWLWFVASTVVYILAGIELVVVVCVAVRKYRERQHEKMVLRPVWPAVAGIIGIPEDQPPTRWLDIPRSMVDDPTADDAEITVGLRAADAEDERRVAALVQLFDQRFGVPHYGSVDYARRLVHLRVRPDEPTIWPAVASVLGVNPACLASEWLHVSDNPHANGAQIFVHLPVEVIDDGPLADDLRTLIRQRFSGEWVVVPNRETRCVVLTRKAPEPEPPTSVDFFTFEAAEHTQGVN